MKDYILINTFSNAMDTIQRCAQFTKDDDPFRWKWIAIGLHHALYSTSIAALEHFDPTQLWKKSGRDKDQDTGQICQVGNSSWMKSRTVSILSTPAYRILWEVNDERPKGNQSIETSIQKVLNTNGKEKLIGFWTALARIMDGHYWMGRDAISSPLQLTDEEIEKIVWLTLEVRNNLAHFLPKSNAIFVPDICEAGLVVLSALRFLIFDSGTIITSPDENILCHIDENLNLLEKALCDSLSG